MNQKLSFGFTFRTWLILFGVLFELHHSLSCKSGSTRSCTIKPDNMKKLLSLVLGVIILASCQKKMDERADSLHGDMVESENAVYPEACHSISFSTNYSAVAGKVPPFRFTKTQYASGRIRTINMLSRANPNHAAFKQQAWEVIGTFTYWEHYARLTGTKQLWEYYKTSTGAAARRSIVKKNINLLFTFRNGKVGQKIDVERVDNIIENRPALTFKTSSTMYGMYPYKIEVLPGSDEPENYFEVWPDKESPNPATTISSITQLRTPSSWALRKTIRYDYVDYGTYPYRNRVYQPTQNWISLEYTICEIMGWIGLDGLDGNGAGYERTRVEVRFHPYNTSSMAIQSQVYKNQRYSGTNLVSYTYGDGVLQKTSWQCRE
jgi:hypothetical protein